MSHAQWRCPLRIAHTARTLLSGTALYLVMAACGASDKGVAAVAGDGGFVAALDAMGDAISDPVRDARADPLPPDIATETCSANSPIVKYGGADSYIVEHAYPGKTVQELALVRVVGESPSLGGYTHRVGGHYGDVYIKNGSVGVPCWPGTPGSVPNGGETSK